MTRHNSSDHPATQAEAGKLKIAIGCGPICPHCGCDTFDDWHLERTLKTFCLGIGGRIKCHGCSKFFGFKQYLDGECHSTATAHPRHPSHQSRPGIERRRNKGLTS